MNDQNTSMQQAQRLHDTLEMSGISLDSTFVMSISEKWEVHRSHRLWRTKVYP